MQQIIKDPNETLDWWLCYGDPQSDNRLGDDTIVSVSPIAFDPSGGITASQVGVNSTPVTDDAGIQHRANTVVALWLSGGAAGTNYEMTVTFTTAGGRTYDDTILIRCLND